MTTFCLIFILAKSVFKKKFTVSTDMFVSYNPENLGRLKKLEYLNLALNNIEVIENLEGQYAEDRRLSFGFSFGFLPWF